MIAASCCSRREIKQVSARKADEEIAKRQQAYERLNAFGGSRVYTDAKDKWDDRDDYMGQ